MTRKLYDNYEEAPRLYWYHSMNILHEDYLAFNKGLKYVGFLTEPAQDVIKERQLRFVAYGDYGRFREFLSRPEIQKKERGYL